MGLHVDVIWGLREIAWSTRNRSFEVVIVA